MKRLLLLLFGLTLLTTTGCTEEVVGRDRRVRIRDTADEEDEKKDETPAQRVTRLRKLLLDDQDNLEAHYELGRIYEKREHHALAAVHFKKMIHLMESDPKTYPLDPAPYYWLGRVRTRQTEFNEAIKHLKAALAVPVPEKAPEWHILNPHYREAAYLLGKIYYHLGKEKLMKSYFDLFIQYGGKRERLAKFFASREQSISPSNR